MDVQNAIAEAFAANGLATDAEKLALLARFMNMLLAWNEKINLISRASANDAATQHIADSALAAGFLPPCATLVDLGSGGGLPGVVIAILRPEIRVTLAETKEKKIKFLQACAESLNLQNIRVFDAARLMPARDHEILVCRAFAALEKIVREGKKYLTPGGKIYAYKGRQSSVMPEAGALPKKLRRRLVPYTLTQADGTHSERALVIIET
ncbi:MAG: 16S rRNA (guanine(527)-N(7))-methyltransferase RsmG [Spirochaetota bacterium]|jgi:16S rRNA (guanine527-N7)-methyltransferase|nr:16S rRNA (guanine(527)-N(7))-methyltransferase RsmG [Spirochaetota bacterium]